MFEVISVYGFILFGIPALAVLASYLVAGIISFVLLKTIDLVFGTRLWKGRWR